MKDSDFTIGKESSSQNILHKGRAKMSQTYLEFRFVSEPLAIDLSVCFSHPKKVIIAHHLEDVIPAIREVENEVEKGYYAAGYLTYESAKAFNPLLAVHHKGKMPYCWFGVFDGPKETSQKKPEGSFQVSDWESLIDKKHYLEAMNRIKEAIHRGETYQVNYTMPLQASFKGDDFAFYQQLRGMQEKGFHGYLNTGRFRILSLSPELFFHWKGQRIVTRPMKGTRPRGRFLAEDLRYAKELYDSMKDRAENAMIVDLLRNDLSSIAEKGSVKVPAVFSIERYPTVYQMTSTVIANTRPHTMLVDVFRALFPCGSITGAPKISTMRTIASLEKGPREVYCGAIGLVMPEKEAIFNVPIRTAIIDSQSKVVTYHVGGGVTWDSSVDGEYEEALTKARILKGSDPLSFSLLESILLKDGKWYLLRRHLNRLKNSAKYFGFQVSLREIERELNEYAKRHSYGTYKVRLLVHQDGSIQIKKEVLAIVQEKVYAVCLASRPISKEDRFLYHKTTNRKVLEDRKNEYPDVFDVLMWNEDGEVTEFTIGNLVVELEGQKWTPPLSSGLLAGTFREELLEKGEIQERVLRKEDLKHCTKLWMINSVRGWVPVKLISSYRNGL